MLCVLRAFNRGGLLEFGSTSSLFLFFLKKRQGFGNFSSLADADKYAFALKVIAVTPSCFALGQFIISVNCFLIRRF